MKTVQSERDYAYGAAILTLRTKLGLTQAELAGLIGITRLAISKWETGEAYPKSEHLKVLIELAVRHQAFPAENTAEAIRTFWKVARQKVLLDEHWLSTLLPESAQEPYVAPTSLQEMPDNTSATIPLSPETHGEGNDAPATPVFYEHKDAAAPKTTRRHKRLLGIVITLVILAIIGAGGMLLFPIIPPQTHPYPAYLSGNDKLTFFDPLNQERGSQWRSYSTSSTGGTCQFTGGAYHVSQQVNGYFNMCPTTRIFSNFAFEVQLTITQGDCGGIAFRMESFERFYYFLICQNGGSEVTKFVSTGSSDAQHLYLATSYAVHTGPGHQNKMAVVANGSIMTFYINEQQIAQEQDSSYPSGKFAFIANPYYNKSPHATEVVYSNAGLWTL